MPQPLFFTFSLNKNRKKKMAASSHSNLACNTYTIRCPSARKGHDLSRLKLGNTKISGTVAISTAKMIRVATSPTVAPPTETGIEHTRQNIPTKMQFVDPYRQGLITGEGVGYRQTVVIRSYEVGPDKTASLESILNLLQETALNHMWMSGLLSDGFGATHGMMRNNLIWTVSRMQLQVDHYPIWGEVLELDTWVGASGKNGMRRDWQIKSHATGVVFARATSAWVMMNQKTRRLSKMPDEVRSEISPWFVEKKAIQEDSPEKIEKLDDDAKYVNSNLQPKRIDLDMNHHVNNVKYVRWMLETIPDHFLEEHQLSGITLEYRKECGDSDIVQSLCHPDEVGMLKDGVQQNSNASIIGGDSLPFKYTHLLQMIGESKNEEIVRGRTTWRKKHSNMPFPILTNCIVQEGFGRLIQNYLKQLKINLLNSRGYFFSSSRGLNSRAKLKIQITMPVPTFEIHLKVGACLK